MSDLHAAVARIALAAPRLSLGPVEICVLAAVRLVTQDEVLAEIGEDRLSDLYVRVVELVDGGARLPRAKATRGIEALREQALLSRVDGAGIVQAGAFALTRLGAAIADGWLEEEALTRQSLVLLTTALRSNLGEVLTAAEAARTPEEWEAVRQHLKVNVASLTEGIDRRRRGLDQQQAAVRAEVSALLAESWFEAVTRCEALLESTTETLAELKDVLMRETGGLLNLLADIEERAVDGGAELAAASAREAQLKIDGIAAWGRARHAAWSEYFGAVQRFIREHVRMDPKRALSRQLQAAITAWPDAPWHLELTHAARYRHLRAPSVARPRVVVRRAAKARERPPEEVPPHGWEDALADRVGAWLAAHPGGELSAALAALLPEQDRFRFAGRITRLLALRGIVVGERERPWAPVDARLEVEEWRVHPREGTK